MLIELHTSNQSKSPLSEVVIISTLTDLGKLHASDIQYIKKKLEKESICYLRTGSLFLLAIKSNLPDTSAHIGLEKWRQAVSDAFEILVKEECSEIVAYDMQENPAYSAAFVESLLLSSYAFHKYKSDQKSPSLNKIKLVSTTLHPSQFSETVSVCEAVKIARDWVNEPLITFTAEDFGRHATELGKAKGFKVQVFDKKKIEKLKMGGLLAINAGSPNPPSFIIAEHKPANSINKQPIVLVGKGVVYDTGGLSLKPTPNSMDYMKCDMAGGAAVIATVSAVAENKLPLYVIALVPATENRPDGNAITPGDVITMHNGKTVEIMNTDAEGRIILADALSYAKQYDPQLVIDVATLTGSAVMSIGNKGIVYMGTAEKQVKDLLESIGLQVYERLVEFPLWEEYGKYLESDIADMKNLGGSDSGAITAGKFLEKFTSYPWLHLDIAAMAYLHQKESYKSKGGTGVGVRLLYQFLKNQTLSDGKPSAF